MINTDIEVIFQALSGNNIVNPGLPSIVMENSSSTGALSLVGEVFELDASSTHTDLQVTAHANAEAVFLFDMDGANSKDITAKINSDNVAKAIHPMRFFSGERLATIEEAINGAAAKKYLFALSVVPTDKISFSSSLIEVDQVTSINELTDVVLGTLSQKHGQFLRIQNGRVEAFNFIGDIEETNKVANYDLVDADFMIPFDATSGNLVAGIPTAVGRKGKIFGVKKIDSSDNYVEVNPSTSGETIDADDKVRLRNQGQTVFIQSDGVKWVGMWEYRA